MPPPPNVIIRKATEEDFDFVTTLMDAALAPYYGGDHIAHARRIFRTHMAGGLDDIGHFSVEQNMFVTEVDGGRAGMIHLVGKRQDTYKISPIIVAHEFRGRLSLGRKLLEHAEQYAKARDARQLYCTVAQQNNGALQFFIRNGFSIAGRSESQYKEGITEVMLYKILDREQLDAQFDTKHISVLPANHGHEPQVRKMLISHLPDHFRGIDDAWVDALFKGYGRRDSGDINQKYKLIFVAVDRSGTVLGVAGATPKKGTPIKVMPFIATTVPAFVALLTDIPFLLKTYGHKLYIHIIPSVEETIALQQRGWRLDAAMPGAYHVDHVTQQWSLDVSEDFMRMMRVKKNFLELIRAGKKTLEVRVGYDNMKTIQAGERIRMMSRADETIVRVDDVRIYATLADMLAVEAPERIAPGLPNEEVVRLLREIYPPDRERLGVYVLELHPEL